MPSKTFATALALATWVSGSVCAEDIQVGYVEGARFRLASGIEETTFSSRGTAIDNSKGVWVDGGIRTFNVRVVVTTDARQGLEELSVDLGATAKGAYEDFSAKGSYNSKLFNSFTNNSEALHAIVMAEVDFGRYQIDHPEISAEASQLAKADVASFREKFGTHFVGQENRKTVLFCIHSVSKLTEEQKTSLKQAIQGSASYADTFSGKFGMDIGKKLEKAARLGDYRFFVGGFGVKAIPAIPENKFDIDATIETFHKTLSSLDRDSSVALSYTCVSYAELGVRIPPAASKNESRYKALAAQHLQLTGQRSQIVQELERVATRNAAGPGDYPKLSAYLQSQLQKVEFARSAISEALAKLRAGGEVPESDYQIEQIGSIWDPLRDLNLRVADDLSHERIRVVLSGRCDLPFDNFQIKVVRITETASGLDREMVFNSSERNGSLTFNEQRNRFTGIVDILQGGDSGMAKKVRYYEIHFHTVNDVDIAYFKASPTS